MLSHNFIYKFKFKIIYLPCQNDATLNSREHPGSCPAISGGVHSTFGNPTRSILPVWKRSLSGTVRLLSPDGREQILPVYWHQLRLRNQLQILCQNGQERRAAVRPILPWTDK